MSKVAQYNYKTKVIKYFFCHLTGSSSFTSFCVGLFPWWRLSLVDTADFLNFILLPWYKASSQAALIESFI